MSAIHATIILVVFALAIWAIVTHIPMNATVKRVIIIFAVVCAVIWLLDITGILGDVKEVKVPNLK